MLKTYITVGILTIIMLSASIYGVIESGSPFETRNKKFDEQRLTDITALTSAVQTYYYKNYRLPDKLDDVKVFLYGAQNTLDPETKKEYEYVKGDGTAYQLCSNFSTDSNDLSNEKSSNSAVYLNRFGEQYKHPKGRHCFDLIAGQNTYGNKVPVPVATTNNTRSAVANSGNNPSCSTLGGIMLVEKGKGTIGCDIKVEGDFDLSKSFCQGQKSQSVQNLIPDAYGRTDQYYATLRGLDPTEEVKVFIYSKSGEKIECNPPLNGG